jgi:hypothetical protein
MVTNLLFVVNIVLTAMDFVYFTEKNITKHKDVSALKLDGESKNFL